MKAGPKFVIAMVLLGAIWIWAGVDYVHKAEKCEAAGGVLTGNEVCVQPVKLVK